MFCKSLNLIILWSTYLVRYLDGRFVGNSHFSDVVQIFFPLLDLYPQNQFLAAFTYLTAQNGSGTYSCSLFCCSSVHHTVRYISRSSGELLLANGHDSLSICPPPLFLVCQIAVHQGSVLQPQIYPSCQTFRWKQPRPCTRMWNPWFLDRYSQCTILHHDQWGHIH